MPFAYNLGAIPDTKDGQDYIYRAPELAAAIAIAEYNLPSGIDNRRQFGPVFNQKQFSSCVGMAVTKSMEYYSWKVTGRSVNLSPGWAYMNARKYDSFPGEAYDGSTMRGGLKAANQIGICEWIQYPFIGDEGPLVYPKEAERSAMAFRVERYARIDSLVEAKHALHKWGVILVTVNVHPGWQNPTDEGIIPYTATTKALDQYHATAIGGYGDEQGAFLLCNSWGNEWGDDGWAWYKYDDFSANVIDIWVPIVVIAKGALYDGARN